MKLPDPNAIHPIHGCDREICVKPTLTDSDLPRAKARIRALPAKQ